MDRSQLLNTIVKSDSHWITNEKIFFCSFSSRWLLPMLRSQSRRHFITTTKRKMFSFCFVPSSSSILCWIIAECETEWHTVWWQIFISICLTSRYVVDERNLISANNILWCMSSIRWENGDNYFFFIISLNFTFKF